jgi:hypothetical protein
VFGAQHTLADLQGLAVKWGGVIEPTSGPQRRRQVIHARQRVRVLGTENLAGGLDRLAEKRLGFRRSSSR